jgi:phosphoesterase RecJ-like protein
MVGPASPAPSAALTGTDAEAFAKRLRTARSVTAFCHEQPDGDTLGAAVAVALIAARLGVDSEVVSVDAVPPAYEFLAGAGEIRHAPSLPPDLAVVCDAATLERVGSVLVAEAAWFSQATVVNIDHHATNARFGAINIVDEHAAATCQVVADLLPLTGVALDRDIASALLAGLVRDSHGFSTSATSPRTLRAAAEAVEAGAPIDAISRATLLELPVPTMRLWARLLGTMGTAYDDQLIYAVLTTDALAETRTEQHDADGLVEFLARGRGIRVAILLRDLGPVTRVSLRTGDGVDAAAIAGSFAGGGHRRRAGCTVPAPVERAVPLVLEACRPYLEG